ATTSRGMIFGIFEGLVTREGQPQLALSWQNPDPLTWVFKLRPGVTFQNGDPFNADAAKFSIERFQDPNTKATYASTMKPVVKTEAVDAMTLKLTTSEPYGGLIDSLGDVLMMSPGAVKAAGADVVKKPVGTGPYVLKSWAVGQQAMLEAFPGYWGPKQNIG